jgi:hypothetical protein
VALAASTISWSRVPAPFAYLAWELGLRGTRATASDLKVDLHFWDRSDAPFLEERIVRGGTASSHDALSGPMQWLKPHAQALISFPVSKSILQNTQLLFGSGRIMTIPGQFLDKYNLPYNTLFQNTDIKLQHIQVFLFFKQLIPTWQLFDELSLYF